MKIFEEVNSQNLYDVFKLGVTLHPLLYLFLNIHDLCDMSQVTMISDVLSLCDLDVIQSIVFCSGLQQANNIKLIMNKPRFDSTRSFSTPVNWFDMLQNLSECCNMTRKFSKARRILS